MVINVYLVEIIHFAIVATTAAADTDGYKFDCRYYYCYYYYYSQHHQ